MTKLPPHVRRDIARMIYERANELGWEDLTNREKAMRYEQWAADPDIGGRLADYIPVERIRVWIKDGPMKEFKRAVRGIGPYSDLVPERKRFEQIIAGKLLGEEYKVLEASIDVKPNRFTAESDDKSVTVIWGNVPELKHLVWAWLNHPSPQDARLVLVNSILQPITSAVEAQAKEIGDRLGTEIRYVTIR